MKPITKIKLKMFIINLFFELLVNSAILIFAYFSNRIIEVIAFYLSWNVFCRVFPKTFHYRASTPFNNVIGCAIFSCMFFAISIRLMLPISVSIFSSVFYGMLFHYILYKLQDYIDLVNEKKKNEINIYKMNEEELRNYAKSKHLSEMIIDTLVLRVIHNYKWIEIQNERNYSRTAIKYHKKRISEILGINL